MNINTDKELESILNILQKFEEDYKKEPLNNIILSINLCQDEIKSFYQYIARDDDDMSDSKGGSKISAQGVLKTSIRRTAEATSEIGRAGLTQAQSSFAAKLGSLLPNYESVFIVFNFVIRMIRSSLVGRYGVLNIAKYLFQLIIVPIVLKTMSIFNTLIKKLLIEPATKSLILACILGAIGGKIFGDGYFSGITYVLGKVFSFIKNKVLTDPKGKYEFVMSAVNWGISAFSFTKENLKDELIKFGKFIIMYIIGMLGSLIGLNFQMFEGIGSLVSGVTSMAKSSNKTEPTPTPTPTPTPIPTPFPEVPVFASAPAPSPSPLATMFSSAATAATSAVFGVKPAPLAPMTMTNPLPEIPIRITGPGADSAEEPVIGANRLRNSEPWSWAYMKVIPFDQLLNSMLSTASPLLRFGIPALGAVLKYKMQVSKGGAAVTTHLDLVSHTLIPQDTLTKDEISQLDHIYGHINKVLEQTTKLDEALTDFTDLIYSDANIEAYNKTRLGGTTILTTKQIEDKKESIRDMFAAGSNTIESVLGLNHYIEGTRDEISEILGFVSHTDELIPMIGTIDKKNLMKFIEH